MSTLNSMPALPTNPEVLLTERVLAREAAAASHRRRADGYLAAAIIALRAAYTAGAAGNVTCRAAVAEIEALGLLPPWPPAPVQTPTPTHLAPPAPPPADATATPAANS